ncbi:MAG: rRNA maturation RNase YbeY [Clostridia bacterium]|nr:rRNA maturation RNase YbeY [Clostridia bacterium]
MNSIEIYQEDVSVDEAVCDLIRCAADTAFSMEGTCAYMTVLLTTEERIRVLNREFRGIDRVTDVLTFPAFDPQTGPGPDGYTGDIAICVKRAYNQAEEYGHSPEREFAFLTVHGCLHLLGYDHMEPDEEKVMIARQKEILKEMELER